MRTWAVNVRGFWKSAFRLFTSGLPWSATGRARMVIPTVRKLSLNTLQASSSPGSVGGVSGWRLSSKYSKASDSMFSAIACHPDCPPPALNHALLQAEGNEFAVEGLELDAVQIVRRVLGDEIRRCVAALGPVVAGGRLVAREGDRGLAGQRLLVARGAAARHPPVLAQLGETAEETPAEFAVGGLGGTQVERRVEPGHAQGALQEVESVAQVLLGVDHDVLGHVGLELGPVGAVDARERKPGDGHGDHQLDQRETPATLCPIAHRPTPRLILRCGPCRRLPTARCARAQSRRCGRSPPGPPCWECPGC